MTHTKEPWMVVKSASGKALILGEEYDNGRRVVASVYEDDAHSIVDCVNACAGLNPAAIPDVVEALRHLTEEHIERGPADVPLGAIRQSDAINRAVAALVALEDQP